MRYLMILLPLAACAGKPPIASHEPPPTVVAVPCADQRPAPIIPLKDAYRPAELAALSFSQFSAVFSGQAVARLNYSDALDIATKACPEKPPG